MRVVALVAAYNRREVTVRCLTALFARVPDDWELSAVLVDDGSTDGTGDAVRALGLAITVVRGDGKLFWGGAMRVAERHALEQGAEALLWLNDDAELSIDALTRLAGVAASIAAGVGPAVVVGALSSRAGNATTYTGWRRRGRWGLVLEAVTPLDEAIPVEAFNGNFVLVPGQIAVELGGVSSSFTHHYGDFDYGLRAVAANHRVYLAPGYFGRDDRNPPDGTYLDRSLPRSVRLRLMVSAKGFPPGEKWAFLRTHGRTGWPVQWVGWYVIHAARILAGR